MAVTITYLLMNLVRTYAIYGFIDKFLKNRRSPSWALWPGYGLYYTVVSAFYLVPTLSNPLSNIVINISFAFLIGCLFYNATYRKRLLCSVFIYILSIASEDCTIVILTVVFKTSLSAMLSNTQLNIIGLIIAMSLLLIITKIVEPLFKRQDAELNHLYWFAAFAIPSGCIYLLHSLVSQLEQDARNELFVLVAILLLFAFNILVFYLYDNLLKEKATAFDNLLLIQQNKAYANQTLLIQDFQTDLRIQQHDLHNHIAAIADLAEQHQTEKLLAYLGQWNNNIITSEPGIHSNNVIVNAMLNSKLYMANQQDTVLYATIDIPPELNIPPVDLTVILGNLFDNALEACIQLPPDERVIHSNICHEHNTLTITVVNTYNNAHLKIHNGKPYTTKKDTESHGIGLDRIRQIVDRNEGLFEYRLSEVNGNNIFITQVLLYGS